MRVLLVAVTLLGCGGDGGEEEFETPEKAKAAVQETWSACTGEPADEQREPCDLCALAVERLEPGMYTCADGSDIAEPLRDVCLSAGPEMDCLFVRAARPACGDAFTRGEAFFVEAGWETPSEALDVCSDNCADGWCDLGEHATLESGPVPQCDDMLAACE